MTDIRIERRERAGDTCRSILAALPDWFGLAEANEAYARAADEHLTLVASDGDADVGLITVVRHAKRSAEVHLMAVLPDHHGEGIGTKLLQRAEAHLRGRGVRFVQVKTLAPANPDAGYARTRAFYEARGFVTLEDFPDLWDVDNPARQMIKTIFPGGLLDLPEPGLPLDLDEFTLRRWTEDDWPAIVTACDDPAIREYTMMPHGISEAAARARAANAADAWDRGFPNVAVVDADDRVVGTVHWMPREVPGNAEAAYWLLPEARGRGWIPLALRHMTDWAFANAGIARMEVLIDLDNHASQRTAEKAGFTREGIRRGYEEVPGRTGRSDLWCFARLSTDDGAMEQAETFRRIAADFTARAEGVDPEGWDAEAPCEGWVTRDIVRHLVEWVPWWFGEGTGHSVDITADVDDDPVAAWAQLRDQVQAILDRPEAETETFDSQMFGGEMPLGVAAERFVTGDVLVHTWDLAKATGQDTSIDADFAAGMYEGMLPMDDMLRQSGQFGPRVEVPDDADPVTKLIAFTGRTP